MRRAVRSESEIPPLLNQLTAAGEDSPSHAEKLHLMQLLRGYGKSAELLVDEFFLRENSKLRTGLLEAECVQKKLREHLQLLTSPPWHPAVFLGCQSTCRGPAALVCSGGTRRVVSFAEGCTPESFLIGDEVLLSADRNAVMEKSPYPSSRGGETAVFERATSDGRLLLKWHDEEMVVDAAGTLADVDLKAGDRVRWERSLWMAFERIERSEGDHLYLQETPSETFDDIGGLDSQIANLQRTIRLHLEHPDTVRKYCLRRKGSLLLVGPPGTGKTMLTRALARWLAELSPSRRSRFMNIKPAALHSMWYSRSEANYREAFRIAREAAEREPEIPVVMFFDEIDSLGPARGNSLAHADDRVLTAFMAELDGLESRGNVFVVGATNRADALDPALLRPGRLGDLVLEIPRPNRRAARAIFSKHLREEIPYEKNGNETEPGAVRTALIDSVISRIYSPNGESDLATVTFRDGRRRPVRAGDLVSGASIAQISINAMERACVREIETGRSGLRLDDLLSAIDEEFTRAVSVLTPLNCHKHLGDFPQDVEVASIDPVLRKTTPPHRYLRID